MLTIVHACRRLRHRASQQALQILQHHNYSPILTKSSALTLPNHGSEQKALLRYKHRIQALPSSRCVGCVRHEHVITSAHSTSSSIASSIPGIIAQADKYPSPGGFTSPAVLLSVRPVSGQLSHHCPHNLVLSALPACSPLCPMSCVAFPALSQVLVASQLHTLTIASPLCSTQRSISCR